MMKNKRCIRYLLPVFILAILNFPLVAKENRQQAIGLGIKPAKQINAVSLVDFNGEETRFPSTDDKWKLVFFGYTACPDVCPMTMHKVTGALKKFPSNGDKLQVFFISIDNQRDKPELLKSFVTYFNPNFIGLTGEAKQISTIEKQFGITKRKFQGKTALAYTLEHSVFIYLMDAEGKLRYMYPASITSKQLAAELQQVIN